MKLQLIKKLNSSGQIMFYVFRDDTMEWCFFTEEEARDRYNVTKHNILKNKDFKPEIIQEEEI